MLERSLPERVAILQNGGITDTMGSKRMIIFGCGYVGRELADMAIADGYEVWIHSRNPESLRSVAQVPPERRIIADLHTHDWHKQLTGTWDVAVNLVSSAGGGLFGYELSYIEGNRSIRHWAQHNRVQRFLYTSATSVYPQTDGEWVTEDDVPPLTELSESGRILRRAEQEILDAEVFEQKTVIRLGGIYGPGRHLYLNSLREGITELPGDGCAFLNLVYLKDICTAVLRLAGLPGRRDAVLVNLVDDHPAPKQEIVDWLAAELGLPTLVFNPGLAGPRGTRRAVGGRLPNRRIANSRLKQLLQWSPAYPSYREGYADILKNA